MLVPSGSTGSENTLLDVGGGEMVEHSVIGHDEHRAIIFHWRGAVEYALTKEQWQGWWRWLSLGSQACTLEARSW